MVSALTIMYGNGLLVHLLLHGVVAIPIACIIWLKFKKLKLVTLFFLIIYAIDIDHLVDYFLANQSFNLDSFVSVKYFFNDFAFIPFHAWEWVLILFLSWKYWVNNNHKPIVFTVMLAMFTHIAWDAFSFHEFIFYSILYRYLH
jgi:hypothetical protein